MGRKSKEQLQKEKATAYKIAWNKENTRLYGIRFSRDKESDIIERLDSEESPKKYIASLIREDLKKRQDDN